MNNIADQRPLWISYTASWASS